MRGEACNSCGKEARIITGNYRFDEVGLPVILKDVKLRECKECGSTDPIIPNLNGLMHAIAFAVVTHPCKLRGEEVRFLRKYLGMGGEHFSKLVDVDKTTLSKWENGQQDIGKNSDRLIRFVAVSKSPELRQQIDEFLREYEKLTDCDPPRKSQLKIDSETLEYEYA
jgi:putative zinc finger/helix-turn-helix YgiT family protein